MGSRVLTCAIFGLLFCCMTADSSLIVPLSGDRLKNMNTSVTNALFKIVSDELTKAEGTLNSLQPLLSDCLTTIEGKQTDCDTCTYSRCETRATALQCDVIKRPSSSASSGCSQPAAICDAKDLANDVKAAVTVAVKSISQVTEKLAGKIENIAVQPVKKIAQSLKNIQNTANQVIKGVEKTANQVASGVENLVKQAGQAISKGVNDAINAVEDVANKVANGVEDAANTVANGAEDAVNTVANGVKKLFEKIGRKRRQTEEPECEAFARDDTACVYYQSECTNCTVLKAVSTTESLITDICTKLDVTQYTGLTSTVGKVDELRNVLENFQFLGLDYDNGAWSASVNNNVKVTFGLDRSNITIASPNPIQPFDPASAAESIANAIFNKIFTQ